MERRVIVLSDNIVSPLGTTSQENYIAVKEGRSNLQSYQGKWDLKEPFYASLLNRDIIEEECNALGIPQNFTFFERVMTLSASKAISSAQIEPSNPDVLFVISSTKGNISLLERKNSDRSSDFPIHKSAHKVAEFFGNKNTPVVVSNACISGVCAQIAAARAIKSHRYKYAVVIGCDVLCKFIVSGFQSFKSLSPIGCKPFDKERIGLNLGEAAATIVLKGVESVGTNEWELVDGAIRNDANHISGPSRTGEGSFRALSYLLKRVDKESLAFVNVHGTSTLYNDEMESIALNRAGLIDTPVNALKGYFGHTLGAAGVLECIISIKGADDGNIIATKGYTTCGVSFPVNLSELNRETQKRSFIKLLSGFGGCNSAILYTKGG